MVTIGVLSPGAMGAALGRAWQRGGARVVTTVEGRSRRTRALAEGLEWLDSIDDVVASAEILASIVPPAQAIGNAEQIAQAAHRRGVRPVVVDLNAVSLPTMERVAAILTDAGCRVVDGSISGPPPGPGAETRVYLSGKDAGVLGCCDSPGLRTRVVGSELGQASAVKMCTAAVYKGMTALMIQSIRTADSYGVSDVVAADWSDMLGPLGADAVRSIAVAVSKADRFPDEMREIAATQEAAGWSAELYEAIARVYEDAHRTQLGTATPEQAASEKDLAKVLSQLRTNRG